MKAAKNKEVELNKEDENSLRGTLFATIVFVGGVILFCIVLLFVLYMTRL